MCKEKRLRPLLLIRFLSTACLATFRETTTDEWESLKEFVTGTTCKVPNSFRRCLPARKGGKRGWDTPTLLLILYREPCTSLTTTTGYYSAPRGTSFSNKKPVCFMAFSFLWLVCLRHMKKVYTKLV